MTKSCLLVRVPETNVDRLRELRGFILESLKQNVLVLPDGTSAEIMEIPPLEGAEVTPVKLPAEEAEPETKKASEGAEKRRILQRLKDYRAAHGLGCLKTVAGATRSKGRISDNTLRMLLTGDAPPLGIADWRRIDRALQRLEEKETTCEVEATPC